MDTKNKAAIANTNDGAAQTLPAAGGSAPHPGKAAVAQDFPAAGNSAPQIPPPEAFNASRDDWAVYQERLQQYMVSQNISTPNAKKATLISLMGNAAYKELRDMCWPAEVSIKSYEDICELLRHQYAEPVVVHHARREFYRAVRTSGEPVQQLLLRYRGLAAKCAFGANYETILLDKIVSSQDGQIFDRLCEEDSTLSLEQALKIIQRKEGQLKLNEMACNYNTVREPRASRPVHERLGPVKRYESARNNNQSSSGRGTEPRQRRIRCIHCGGTNHQTRECIHKAASCHHCKQPGHIATICPKKRTKYVASGQLERAQETKEEEEYEFYTDSDEYTGPDFEVKVNNIGTKSSVNSPYDVFLTVSGKKIEFQIDTGAGISAISSRQYHKELKHVPLEKTTVKLTGYSGEQLHLIGVIQPTIKLLEKTVYGRIYIVQNGGPPILGRNILNKLGFDFTFKTSTSTKILNITEINNEAAKIFQAFPDLFDGQLGTYSGRKVKLELKPNASAKFCRARPVPFAFQKQYDEEFDALEKLGVITRTDTSDWGTPVVPVLKPNGKIRICGDYKTTINPQLVEVKYPLPRVEELFAKIKGGQMFTKLDLSRGYNQLVLDDDSKKLVALSTHRGVYLMNRLPFGITPASGIFQREIERILQGIPNVVNFIDDILITGKNNEEHLRTIKRVLKRLRDVGLKLEKSKCEFFQHEVTYLGHTISKDGLKKCKKNVDAIANAPLPKSVTEVRAFCGMANYYGKFVNNMAGTLGPLYRLLRKDVKFDWTADCDNAVKSIKNAIVSDNVLCHFDPDLPVVLTCDASNRGLGAILSHRIAGNIIKPIAFASRTLNNAEANYSTIHKEGLAIIFGVKKFYQFLVGRHFILQTDHKPLVSIFKPTNGIPVMAAGRVQRWSVYLSGFDYTIEHVKSEHNLSDVLSRLPLQKGEPNSEVDEENMYLNFMSNNFPSKTVTYKDIQRESRKDVEIAAIANAVKNNDWRDVFERKPELKAFQNKGDEMAVERDILMWGGRVVIPKKLRQDMLQSVHLSHMGIVKTKSLCRSHFWWPNLDKDIESMIKNCEQCSQLLPDPAKTELIPWRSEERPWSRIHLDFAGPIKNVYLLIIVDAFSKWIEVFITKNPNAQFTLDKLYEISCRFGIPDTIVTDNGAQFKNNEFETFTTKFGIKHVFTAPGFPATNGQAESAVKVVKKGIRATLGDGSTRDLQSVLNQFLFDYRITPHTSTLDSPAKLLMKRELRNRLSLIKPLTTSETIENQQRRQIRNHGGRVMRHILVGDRVWARDYTNPNKKAWAAGRIRQILGKRNFLVQFGGAGRLIKRHIDQIRLRASAAETQTNNGNDTSRPNPMYNEEGEANRDREREERQRSGTAGQRTSHCTPERRRASAAEPILPEPSISTAAVSVAPEAQENPRTPPSIPLDELSAVVGPSTSANASCTTGTEITTRNETPTETTTHTRTRTRRNPDRLMYDH